MKSSTLSICAAAAIAMTPMAAYSDDNDVKNCADTFLAEYFPGQKSTIRIETEYSPSGPLVLRARNSEVSLTATGKTSGMVLATATCTVKDGRVSVVTIGKLNATAAR